MRSKMPVQRGHPFYDLARRQRNAQNWLGNMLPPNRHSSYIVRSYFGSEIMTQPMFIFVQTHVTTQLFSKRFHLAVFGKHPFGLCLYYLAVCAPSGQYIKTKTEHPEIHGDNWVNTNNSMTQLFATCYNTRIFAKTIAPHTGAPPLV